MTYAHPLYFKSRLKFGLAATVGFLIIAVFALSPILIAMLAGAIGESNGCTVDETGAHPCVIGGTDYGGLISTMFVFGWLFLLSVPAGFALMIVWIKKIWEEYKFRKHSIAVNLADLKDLSVHESVGRTYLEAKINQQGIETPIGILFNHKSDERKFKQGKVVIIEGILKTHTDGSRLILQDSRVLLKHQI